MKKESTVGKGLRLGLLFLLFFVVVLATSVIRTLSPSDIQRFLRNPFEKEAVLVPLPAKDPANEVLVLLKEKGIPFEETPQASDSALLVRMDSETVILFHANKELLPQVSSLQIILSRLTIEGRKAKMIDFRFKDPLVVY